MDTATPYGPPPTYTIPAPAGYTCASCRVWVPWGQAHWCPNWTQNTPPMVEQPEYLVLIADALERIAQALEKQHGA